MDTLLPETGMGTHARFHARTLAGSIMSLIRAGIRAWDESAGQAGLADLSRQGFALLEGARGLRLPMNRGGA